MLNCGGVDSFLDSHKSGGVVRKWPARKIAATPKEVRVDDPTRWFQAKTGWVVDFSVQFHIFKFLYIKFIQIN